MPRSNGPGNPLEPSVSLLVKLGSIAVHVQEMLGPTGHQFDKTALDALNDDYEVKAWVHAMDAMALLPVKRS